MAKKKNLNNELFGHLTYVAGDLWKRPIELTIFKRLCIVYLMVDVSPRTGIEQNQKNAYKFFCEHTNNIISSVEKAVFDYYQTICDEYRDRLGIVNPDDDSVPIIKANRDVSRLVKLEGVTFPYVRPQPTFGFHFDCTWEKEHGLAVKFESGQVSEVGFQDIVL